MRISPTNVGSRARRDFVAGRRLGGEGLPDFNTPRGETFPNLEMAGSGLA